MTKRDIVNSINYVNEDMMTLGNIVDSLNSRVFMLELSNRELVKKSDTFATLLKHIIHLLANSDEKNGETLKQYVRTIDELIKCDDVSTQDSEYNQKIIDRMNMFVLELTDRK